MNNLTKIERSAALIAAGFKTQAYAAEALGVCRHSINRWVRGDNKYCQIEIYGPKGQTCKALVPIDFAIAVYGKKVKTTKRS